MHATVESAAVPVSSAIPRFATLPWGPYPERSIRRLDQPTELSRLFSPKRSESELKPARIRRHLTAINTRREQLDSITDQELRVLSRDLGPRLRRDGFTRGLLIEALAFSAVAAERGLRQRPRDVQLLGAWALLRGRLTEMETGEGKTLTVALAAATAAAAGIPVHVVTTNDYLATRDAERIGAFYRLLGLSVGAVTAGQSEAERRRVYTGDVTYCTNKQLVFDYLRDRSLLGNDHGALGLQLEGLYRSQRRRPQLLLRGLYCALVDEADSVLIDEARTPLLLSQPTRNPSRNAALIAALNLAQQLEPGRDYRLDPRHRRVELTPTGQAWLNGHALDLSGFWSSPGRRELLAAQALSALHLYQRDRDYLIRDGVIEIIDPHTGRTMPDRAWEQGLHGLVELKEKLRPSDEREVLARMTYQSFFRRYHWLAGITGTAREVRAEVRRVYDLSFYRIPTYKPCLRRRLGARLFADREQQNRAILERVRDLAENGQPVLIGTRSLAHSELLSELFHAHGVEHQLLNARQDRDEAGIVATAGQRATVTIATNMAGRGTDIPLGEGVAKLGGLHVIATEMNDSGRIDRQLFGRSARQGDPGSYEVIQALTDDLARRHLPSGLRHSLGASGPTRGALAGAVMRWIQRREERLLAADRRRLLKQERELTDKLAFTGFWE